MIDAVQTKVACRIWSIVSLTLLDIRLLGLVGQELVQFLLIGITQLGEVELRRGVHFGAGKRDIIDVSNIKAVRSGSIALGTGKNA